MIIKKHYSTRLYFVWLLMVLVFITKANAQGDKIIGKWTGNFGNKEITIVIDKIEGNIIYGYNSVGNNKRKISGNYTISDGNITAKLKEPGDDKYDGLFTINFINDKEANGNWKMFKGNSYKEFTIKKAIVTKKNKRNNLLGMWHGYYGRHNYKWYIKIDSVEKNKIYGIARDGLYKTNYDITGAFIYEDGKYDVTFKQIKNDKTRKKTLVSATFDLQKKTGVYDDIKIIKSSSKKSELIKGLKSRWIGKLGYNDNFFDGTITKITKDSIYGFIIENKQKHYYKGLYEVRSHGWDSSIGISMYDQNKNALHLRYMDGKIDGVKVSNNRNEEKIEAKKSNKIPQSPERIRLLNSRISHLEKKVQKLSGLFNEILRYGTYTPSSTIKKTKDLMFEIDKWTKENPIPNDNNLLNIEQEQRMSKIKTFLLNSRMNSKIVKVLGN